MSSTGIGKHMSKVNVGNVVDNFIFDTLDDSGLNMHDVVKQHRKTAFIFLRYYGCPLCQMDMHEMAKNYSALTDDDAYIYVVLQSDKEKLKEKLEGHALPYSIICDPTQALYKQLEIDVAEDKAKLLDAKTALKIGKMKLGGYQHGEYEGEELQLPATFILDKDAKASYVHYGKGAGDTPSVNKLISLLHE